jgi:hypothetical protein
MPRFDELSEGDVEDIFQYIRAGAREALGTRKPADAPKPPSAHL